MIKSDWSECRFCKFPAIGECIRQVVTVNGSCPMCLHDMTIHDIVSAGIVTESYANGVGGLAI